MRPDSLIPAPATVRRREHGRRFVERTVGEHAQRPVCGATIAQADVPARLHRRRSVTARHSSGAVDVVEDRRRRVDERRGRIVPIATAARETSPEGAVRARRGVEQIGPSADQAGETLVPPNVIRVSAPEARSPTQMSAAVRPRRARRRPGVESGADRDRRQAGECRCAGTVRPGALGPAALGQSASGRRRRRRTGQALGLERGQRRVELASTETLLVERRRLQVRRRRRGGDSPVPAGMPRVTPLRSVTRRGSDEQ